MSKRALFAKFTPKAGQKDALIAALQPMMEQVQSEAGTEVYVMHVGDDDSIWFYELYSDEDAFKTHGGSDAMKAAFGALGDLIEGRAELVFGTPQGAKGISV